MKTKLMLAAMLASISIAQAGPPITPAKIKKPLHISQVKSIFHHSEPTAPVQKDSASVQQNGAEGAANTTEAATKPVSKKVHLNTFPNHPTSAPGPK